MNAKTRWHVAVNEYKWARCRGYFASRYCKKLSFMHALWYAITIFFEKVHKPEQP